MVAALRIGIIKNLPFRASRNFESPARESPTTDSAQCAHKGSHSPFREPLTMPKTLMFHSCLRFKVCIIPVCGSTIHGCGIAHRNHKKGCEKFSFSCHLTKKSWQNKRQPFLQQSRKREKSDPVQTRIHVYCHCGFEQKRM